MSAEVLPNEVVTFPLVPKVVSTVPGAALATAAARSVAIRAAGTLLCTGAFPRLVVVPGAAWTCAAHSAAESRRPAPSRPGARGNFQFVCRGSRAVAVFGGAFRVAAAPIGAGPAPPL